jgi:1-acyl-sn-glycerol-3-phosphate acyltransferase
MLVAPFDRKRALALIGRWGVAGPALFGIDLEVKDESGCDYGSPPYLFVMLNQTTLLDSFVLPVSLPLPVRCVINLEFALLPFVGWARWLAGDVMIVRGWRKHAVARLGRVEELLRRGESFLISIEGKRSKDGSLNPYKKGPVMLALHSGATIVPVFMKGCLEVWPYGTWRVRPGKVTLTLLPPISVQGLTERAKDELLARIRAVAEEHVLSDRSPSTLAARTGGPDGIASAVGSA